MEHFFYCSLFDNDERQQRRTGTNHKAEDISRCCSRWVINSRCFVWFYSAAKYFLQILMRSKLKLNTSAAEKRVPWN